MATAIEAMPGDAPVDPDAQATVTDFLDYTEYLPSDLIRSLTLIRKLDEAYLSSTHKIHELTTTYGALPTIPISQRPNARDTRRQISHKLDFVLGAREASYAEASRAYDEVDRHFNRLTNIITKLHALPKPPSRDPTPVPQPRSPQMNRARFGRKEESGATPPPRITLRLDSARAAASASRNHGTAHRARHRSRKITIPGEVLPPPNPDSPPPMTETDWESVPPSPIPMPTSRVGAPSRSRSVKPGRIKVPKPPKPLRIKVPKVPRPPRPPRPPGAMGTNVHSAVAGISTSNALSLLSPPPPDAKPGSEHAPWMRLTEWEMAKLRKRMKKNAIWSPSETMIRRELSEAGRGPENYRLAKAKADATGEEFIDDDNIATTAPGKPLAPGEISADSLGLGETKLSNRGMKLNEAKKLKRELVARELAAQEEAAQEAAQAAAEIEAAGKRLGGIGSAFKNLFSRGGDGSNGNTAKDEKSAVKTPKKRKRDATPRTEDSQADSDAATPPTKPTPKKRKAVPTPVVKTITTTIPLAAPAPSPIKPISSSTPTPKSPPAVESRKPTAASSRSHRPSPTIKAAHPAPEPVAIPSRPASRPSSRRASTGPEPTSRDHLRRKSATPAPAPLATAASRRSKRPAPGPVTSSQDGGAAVSVGRRKNAPRKRGTAAAANAAIAAKKAAEGTTTTSRDLKEEEAKAEEEAAGEEIDPDEPRYCLCGDCEREWFHLECVGLQEPPGRRTKWYCPDCKAKLGKK
ncbi:hypothetical protein MMC24_004266 [Lignoscripta atroalba]|nr:hypothetical protein [Lignoscripta atroalba]